VARHRAVGASAHIDIRPSGVLDAHDATLSEICDALPTYADVCLAAGDLDTSTLQTAPNDDSS
jgi:hypothetical protein